MSFTGWLITGVILIFILTLVIGTGWYIRNRSNPTPKSPDPFLSPLLWSSPAAGPDPNKNFCQLYDFPTDVVNIDGVPTVVPGTPTFNTNILNNLMGMTGYPSCLDTDQIIAQQVFHTCTGPNGVNDRSITRCSLIAGGYTGIGGTESYYTDSNCLAIRQCPGQLSLVSVNFQAPTVPNAFCFEKQGTGQNIIMSPCDPDNPNQLFRVTRVNPGQDPGALQPGREQNGLITQILDRDTGLCVVPGTGTTVTLYDPSYLTPIHSLCVGGIDTLQGQNVILSACTGGQFPGYVWALLPSVSFCSVTGGCTGCRGCPGCTRQADSNNCAGCDGCSGHATSPTPPQIVYVGNLNLNDIPVGPTGFQGLTGSNSIIQWLVSNNAKSLYFGGTGDGLILRNMSTDVVECINKPYTAQYLNLTTYNTLIREEVCLAEQTLGTPFCVGL